MKRCGISNVWISIDGANRDCECFASDLPYKADNKSRTNKIDVSYMCAVSAEDGWLVAFFINYGDRVYSIALTEMCDFLEDNGIMIQSIIMDRGLLILSALKMVHGREFEYVVMLKYNTFAYTICS